MRTRLGQTLVCLLIFVEKTLLLSLSIIGISSLLARLMQWKDVVSQARPMACKTRKDVAEACAKEMDMNIDLDNCKYVGDTTSVICRNCLNKYRAFPCFLRDQRKIIENIKKGLHVIAPVCDSESSFPLKNSVIRLYI